MDILVTNNKTTFEHGILDFNDFLHLQLTPLVQKVRLQLKHIENLIQLQEYTRNKIQRVNRLLDTIDEYWERLPLENATINQYNQPMLDKLEHTFFEFSEKYRQLAQLQGDYFDYNFLDTTMDLLVISIEQLKTSIRDVIDKSIETRYITVHEKLADYNDITNDEDDLLTPAIANGAVRLLTYDELPEPWRNNMHIHTGYRFISKPSACFRSWFYLHNESGNIYTHLTGLSIFFAIGIYELYFSDLLKNEPMFDWIMCALFFLAVCKCLICSILWHTLAAINNYRIYSRVACLDYIGISTLICAILMISEYYGFYCNAFWRNIYLTGSGSLALMGITMPWMPWFDRPESQWIKVVFFVAIASSGFIPIFHMLSICGASKVLPFLTPVWKSISCYVLGVIVYSNRFPERFWPGKFDYIGHSHQWWHILVCAGIYWNYVAAKNYYPHRQEFCECS